MKNVRSVALALRSAGLCACLAAAGCHQPSQAATLHPPAGEVWITPQQQDAAQIATVAAEERDLPSELVAGGRVSFDEQRIAHVFSPVGGRVGQVLVQLGQRVKRGAPLAVVDAPEVGSALADAGKARADLVAARRELKRQQDLFAAQAGARRELEAAEDAVAKADAELRRASARARMFGGGAQVSQHVTLRSPIDGEVIARLVNPGSEIQGQLGGGTAQELFTVGSLDSVWVFADVFEQDLAKVRQGATVKVTPLAYGNQPPLEGRVDWISAQLDPQTRTARVRCTLPNPDRLLKAEMYATVAITTDSRRALAVPRSALLKLADQTVVFVQLPRTENGLLRYERRAVSVPEATGELLPVQRGLQRGEQVVVSGAILLSGMI